MKTIEFIFIKGRWKVNAISTTPKRKTRRIRYIKSRNILQVTANFIKQSYKVGKSCARPHKLINWDLSHS